MADNALYARRSWEESRSMRVSVDALVRAHTPPPRYAGEETGKVRLVPVLSARHNMLWLSLRVGRDRLYVVHRLGEFAARVADGESHRYGRSLAFAHREDAFEDPELLRRLLALFYGRTGTEDELPVAGAALDDVMRLLLGRDVLLRGVEGVVPARVVEGTASLAVSLANEAHGAKLRVRA